MDILEETIKGFNGLTLQSKINDSAYYNSDKDDAEIDPKSDQLVATNTSDRKKRKVTDTDTTGRNSPHKLLINRLIPEIIPIKIPSINPPIADGVAASGETLHARQKITSEEIVTNLAFLRSYTSKLEEHGRGDSMGRKHFRNPPHID